VRVLLLHDYGTLNGGAEVMVAGAREALRARGHEALLFTSTAHPLPLPIVSDRTCFGTTGPLRRLTQVANPQAALRLRRLVREFRPDVVFTKMFLGQLSPLVLPVLRGVPAVLNVINYNLICPLNTKTLPDGTPCMQRAGAACHASGCLPWAGVLRGVAQRALTDLDVFDQVVANSQWIAGRLRAEGIRVDGWLHNGVAPVPARPRLGELPMVGYSGRLVPKKGVDCLLEAMAILRRRIRGVRLLIAGDGPERERLQGLAADLGIADAVDFLGHLDAAEQERALAPAWIQAVPSRWAEPFGLVAAEAMMRGTAVIVSDAGGLAEQVVEGETGFCVPAGNPDAWAEALAGILADRQHAERLGARAREHALANFSFDIYIERLEALLDSVARSNGVAARA
jgi:glycosyltransferase involved in cell wall biosynthesis